MAATVIINRLTGAGPTKTAITGINTRANAADAHSTADTTNPIRVPAAGTNYSFWVNTRLEVTVAPATGIDNIKWYTDGSNNFATGVTMKAHTANTYGQATGTAGTTGTQLTVANYGDGVDDLNGAPTNAFAFTSGSPLSVTGSIGATTGDLGHLVVYQLEVATTAGPGTTGTETLTFSYDES